MRYYKSFLKIIAAAVLVAVILCPCVSFSGVLAANDEAFSIDIFYHDNGKALEGAEFSVFMIATSDESGDIAVTEQFSGYPVDIRPDSGISRALAATLEGFVLRDGLSPLKTGAIDSKGSLLISSKNSQLSRGVYLIIGKRFFSDGKMYDPAPFIISLPSYDEDSGILTPDVTIQAKYDVTLYNLRGERPEGSSISRRALKIWSGEGPHPDEITVELLRDGKLFDTAVLSSANGWSHEWNDLNSIYRWHLTEHVPEGYNVTVIREGITFVVTNKVQTVNEDQPNGSNGSGNGSDSSLPQTGLLWWPVALFAAVGLALLVTALVIKRRAHRSASSVATSIVGAVALVAALSLCGYNVYSDAAAAETADTIYSALSAKINSGEADTEANATDGAEEVIPNYVLDPSRPMPETKIDGVSYIGTLEIPSIDARLPVAGSFTYDTLLSVPCRYAGSAYLGDMIICAHNYTSQFANISRLGIGDAVIFTDTDGNSFSYVVSETEVISGENVEEMTAGDWDLTLFTCTLGGQSRITVRCTEDR